MAQANWFLRERLIEHVLARPEPVVVLEAPAGMGKSVLLRQIAERTGATLHVGPESPDGKGELVLWDIPPYGRPMPLPEGLFGAGKRIIIAKRPGVELAGLIRAFAYGQATRIEARDLLLDRDEAVRAFGREADERLDRSGGWPLAAFNGDRIADMSAFIEREILDHVSSEELVDLKHLLEGGTVPARQESSVLPFALPGERDRLELNVRIWTDHL